MGMDFLLTDEMETILESSYDGIWITDGDGKVLYTNSANERISGFSREEVLGRYTQELLDKKLFSHSVTLEVINKKKRVTIMGYNYNSKKNVLITGNPVFDKNNNLIRIVNNIRDITDLNNLKEDSENKDKLIEQQKNELVHLRSQQVYANNEMVVNSTVMRQTVEQAVRVGMFDSKVLILGESGAGKEVIAQAIVRSSERRDEAFIKVNCSAIPENLQESELFGYEKGAFTGANQKGKMGMFEMAQRGTIFLDEVADIPLNLQVKLLRVIQEQELMRVGGTKPIKLDVRIIAATNKDIEEMVRKGVFREDLYYRLNVVIIRVPPLRDRIEDIPALANYFLKRFITKYKQDKIISTEAMDLLMAYSWPGNVRELENVIENLVVQVRDKIIIPSHLMLKFCQETGTLLPQIKVNGLMPLKEAVQQVEEDLIRKALRKYGSTRKAATALGVDQSTIVRKAQKLRIFDINLEES